MVKMRVQAQHLHSGDVVGSGEIVHHVSAGVRTPKGKVDVWLKRKSDGSDARMAQWGKYTLINVDRNDKDV